MLVGVPVPVAGSDGHHRAGLQRVPAGVTHVRHPARQQHGELQEVVGVGLDGAVEGDDGAGDRVAVGAEHLASTKTVHRVPSAGSC